MDLELSAVDGPYPEFGRLIQKALRVNQPLASVISTRLACRLLGASHETISSMASGHRPSRSLVIEFARAMKVNVNDLLTAAEYPLLGKKAEV
ncbi:MAG: hypothetical protein ACRYFS_15415 [Janthinobacterium lividum]